jgi:hypothetical protein
MYAVVPYMYAGLFPAVSEVETASRKPGAVERALRARSSLNDDNAPGGRVPPAIHRPSRITHHASLSYG